jgi:NADPH-dependent curcumin reductase CurA
MLNFTVQVNVSVSVLDGFTPSTVTDEVAAVLDSYLTYSGWDFAETINKNILIAKASQVPGVRYISSLAIVITGSTTYAEMEEVASVETGNVTILRAGVVPVGSAEVTAI